jgi:hypothetical protein
VRDIFCGLPLLGEFDPWAIISPIVRFLGPESISYSSFDILIFGTELIFASGTLALLALGGSAITLSPSPIEVPQEEQKLGFFNEY